MSYRLYYLVDGREKSVSLPYSSLDMALKNAKPILERELKAPKSPTNLLDYFISDGKMIVFCNDPSTYAAHKQSLESTLKQQIAVKQEKKNDKKWVSRILWTLREHYLNAKPLDRL